MWGGQGGGRTGTGTWVTVMWEDWDRDIGQQGHWDQGRDRGVTWARPGDWHQDSNRRD